MFIYTFFFFNEDRFSIAFIRRSAYLLAIFVTELEESRIKRRNTLSAIYAEDVTLCKKVVILCSRRSIVGVM